jgi:hypothetical protein
MRMNHGMGCCSNCCRDKSEKKKIESLQSESDETVAIEIAVGMVRDRRKKATVRERLKIGKVDA